MDAVRCIQKGEGKVNIKRGLDVTIIVLVVLTDGIYHLLVCTNVMLVSV